jgi:hypothetical protein
MAVRALDSLGEQVRIYIDLLAFCPYSPRGSFAARSLAGLNLPDT